MAPKLNLKICYLYPDLMDTYGDTGNITTLVKRCTVRNIDVKVNSRSLKDEIGTDEFDLFFFGGGQDKIQTLVGKDLQKKQRAIIDSVEHGAVLLSICGGYQLLQKYFKTISQDTITGIGLFDAHTEGSNNRLVQNLLIEINPELAIIINQNYRALSTTNSASTLIGFENHSGKTYLSEKSQPLGYVVKGAGNNGKDKTEGIKYKNAFGCYMHGSLLPKNPHFADYLIKQALQRKYGKIQLEPLDDYFEWQSHLQSIKKTRSQG